MAEDYLHRDEAPFGPQVWARIDEAVIETAKTRLCARRLLHTDGPHGLGLKSIPGPEQTLHEGEEVSVTASGVQPLVGIQAGFRIPKRDIAAHVSMGAPLDLRDAVQGGVACAQREDALLFDGDKKVGALGLLTGQGAAAHKLGAWDEVGQAIEDLIAAVDKLDRAGFHGPYTVALNAMRYNRLLRRYPQGNALELDHLRQLVTDGVVKAPALSKGGVLVAAGRQFASIVLGQDLSVGFVGPDAGDYEFVVSETLALRLAVPEAVCVLQ